MTRRSSRRDRRRRWSGTPRARRAWNAWAERHARAQEGARRRPEAWANRSALGRRECRHATLARAGGSRVQHATAVQQALPLRSRGAALRRDFVFPANRLVFERATFSGVARSSATFLPAVRGATSRRGADLLRRRLVRARDLLRRRLVRRARPSPPRLFVRLQPRGAPSPPSPGSRARPSPPPPRSRARPSSMPPRSMAPPSRAERS